LASRGRSCPFIHSRGPAPVWRFWPGNRRSVAYNVTIENRASRIDDVMSPPEDKGDKAWSVSIDQLEDLLRN
jgi:hypothetical protein